MIIKDTIINLKLVTHIHKEDKVVTDFGKYVGTIYKLHIHYVSGKVTIVEYDQNEDKRNRDFDNIGKLIFD